MLNRTQMWIFKLQASTYESTATQFGNSVNFQKILVRYFSLRAFFRRLLANCLVQIVQIQPSGGLSAYFSLCIVCERDRPCSCVPVWCIIFPSRLHIVNKYLPRNVLAPWHDGFESTSEQWSWSTIGCWRPIAGEGRAARTCSDHGS